ncbi:MAG: glycerophosphodiester phosphodiesterase [Promethearchaeota archaeon]
MISTFLFIGHRGTRRDFDENTVTAFNKAIEFGANYIEFDIRKTKDHQLVVFHDSNLSRTTNGSGLLKDFSYREIKNLKTLINRDTISSLIDVLDKFVGKVNFMIDLKEEGLINEMVKIVKEKDLISNTVISSKFLNELLEIKREIPKIRICYNISKGVGLTLAEFLGMGSDVKKKYNFDMISLNSNLLSQNFIKKCHSNRTRALSWNFIDEKNPLRKINDLICQGIDGILFDDYKNIKKIKMKYS